MKDLIYHVYLNNDHEYHVPLEEVRTSGIKYTSRSNHRYSNGGKVNSKIAERLKPSNTPEWVDFNKAIGVDLTNRFSRSFCFPIFTDKILVFNKDISLSIYDQAFYEDLIDFDDEAQNFDTGKSLEHWIKKYWDSMLAYDEYMKKKPYPNAEVLIFQSVPNEIIKVCEK